MKRLILSLFVVLLGATSAMGQRSYYGEWVVKSSGQLIRKIYDNGSVMRLDEIDDKGIHPCIIFKDSVVMLMPEQKAYGVFTGESMKGKKRTMLGVESEIIRIDKQYTFIKKEVITGVECTHYHFKQTDASKYNAGGMTGTNEGSQIYDVWIAPDIRHPMQKENPNAFNPRLEKMGKIVFGPQPADLFVVPKGWKRMNMDAMMDGINQQMKGMFEKQKQAVDDLQKLEKGEKSSNQELNELMEGFKAMEQLFKAKKK